jgi:hypothetical protein
MEVHRLALMVHNMLAQVAEEQVQLEEMEQAVLEVMEEMVRMPTLLGLQ